MVRLHALRAFATLGLVACLLLLSRVPVCAEKTCPMAKLARAACRELGLDCCKTAGERFAHASVQPQLPDLFVAPTAGFAAVAVAEPLPAPPRTAPLPAPAVLQGVGLHTLFAVFLI
jgi:hypothetical protein